MVEALSRSIKENYLKIPSILTSYLIPFAPRLQMTAAFMNVLTIIED
jgi:hypothetical protein